MRNGSNCAWHDLQDMLDMSDDSDDDEEGSEDDDEKSPEEEKPAKAVEIHLCF